MPTSSSFNWKKGIWTADTKIWDQKTNVASVCVAGDWAPIRTFEQALETCPESVYGDLLPVLKSADLSIVNLECPLSDRGQAVYKSGSVFKGKKCHVKALTTVPFNVATLANNHIFDFGLDAFKDTLDVLNCNHIQWTGAGMSLKEAEKPLVLTVNDIKIAIVNFSEGEDLTAAGKGHGVMGWEISRIVDTIRELKSTMDFIIVISHCGIEYIPFPPPYVARAFKHMAKAGANMVIGHHPHVPQGLEFYHGIPLIYSLGNFIFYQNTDLKYRKLGYLVKFKVNRDSLLSLELIPYGIHDTGLSRLSRTENILFLQKIKNISQSLHDKKKMDETWHGFLDYYGTSGFLNEISMIMKKIETDPQKGAAMFRNRLTTRQHYHHWKDFLTRLVEKKLNSSPLWSRRLIEEWLTLKKNIPFKDN